MLFWDVSKNNEIESFDSSGSGGIRAFWDEQGFPYCTEGDKVMIGNQWVTLKCYDVEQINERESTYQKTTKKDAFGYHKGHKMDIDEHNWIFLREYVSLSFSYMTFAINNKKNDHQSFIHEEYDFDKEQYNYIINKRTFLHDEGIINDHKLLDYILRNFNDLDPILLDQI